MAGLGWGNGIALRARIKEVAAAIGDGLVTDVGDGSENIITDAGDWIITG